MSGGRSKPFFGWWCKYGSAIRISALSKQQASIRYLAQYSWPVLPYYRIRCCWRVSWFPLFHTFFSWAVIVLISILSNTVASIDTVRVPSLMPWCTFDIFLLECYSGGCLSSHYLSPCPDFKFQKYLFQFTIATVQGCVHTTSSNYLMRLSHRTGLNPTHFSHTSHLLTSSPSSFLNLPPGFSHRDFFTPSMYSSSNSPLYLNLSSFLSTNVTLHPVKNSTSQEKTAHNHFSTTCLWLGVLKTCRWWKL